MHVDTYHANIEAATQEYVRIHCTVTYWKLLLNLVQYTSTQMDIKPGLNGKIWLHGHTINWRLTIIYELNVSIWNGNNLKLYETRKPFNWRPTARFAIEFWICTLETMDLHICYQYSDPDLPKPGSGNVDMQINNY